MVEHHPSAGFRINLVDIAVLLASIPISLWLAGLIGGFAGLVPLVVGHFFLFCNVFRVRRSLELIWAGIAVANTAIWAITCDPPCWWAIYAGILPLSVVVIIVELRSPRYHGIFAHRLNPQGITQWEQRCA